MPSPVVDDLDLPVFDYTEPGLTGEVYHQRLAAVREQGWLARSPLSYVVLDRDRASSSCAPGRPRSPAGRSPTCSGSPAAGCAR